MSAERIILFGGTFNPIHSAHVALARFAQGYLAAHKVIFIPNGNPPHKDQEDIGTPVPDRLTMCELATRSYKGFEVDSYECEQTKTCYTINTIRHFKEKFGPDVELFYLIGPDSLEDLRNWYEVDDLVKECKFAVLMNEEFAKEKFSGEGEVWHEKSPWNEFPCYKEMEAVFMKSPPLKIRSTLIRKMAAEGMPLEMFVPPQVASYIKANKLYDPENKD